ncbi:hypothetical protein M9Y10_022239 [Tritrichomonas musculus]|uniref:BRCT domain-containing protein n=1 Tax=Tritrichomonas musculus TaxID=1915356 RepID=A0ABR2KV14_9EUKA
MVEVFLSPLLSENDKYHASNLIKQIYPNATFAPKLTPEVSFRIVNPKDILYITKMNCLTMTILCLKHTIEKKINIKDLQTDWRIYCNLFLYNKKIAFYKLEEKQIKRYSTMVKCMGGIILNNIDSNNVDYVITKESENKVLQLGVLPSWIETLFYESQYVKPFYFYPKDHSSKKVNKYYSNSSNLNQNDHERNKRKYSEANKLIKFSPMNTRKNNLRTPVNVLRSIKGDNAGFILRMHDNSQDIRSFINDPYIENKNDSNAIFTNYNNNNDEKESNDNDITNCKISQTNAHNKNSNNDPTKSILSHNAIFNNISTEINHNKLEGNANDLHAVSENIVNLIEDKRNSKKILTKSDKSDDDDDVVIITQENYFNNIEKNKKKNDRIRFESNKENLINLNTDEKFETNLPNFRNYEKSKKDIQSFSQRKPFTVITDLNAMPNKIEQASKKAEKQNTNVFKNTQKEKFTSRFLSSSSSFDEDEIKIIEESFNNSENKENQKKQENGILNAIQSINAYTKIYNDCNNNKFKNTNKHTSQSFDFELEDFSQVSQQYPAPSPMIIEYEQEENVLGTENFSENDPFLLILSNL